MLQDWTNTYNYFYKSPKKKKIWKQNSNLILRTKIEIQFRLPLSVGDAPKNDDYFKAIKTKKGKYE